MSKFEVKSSVVKNMRKNNLLRTDMFNLHEGFVGQYETTGVRAFVGRNDKKDEGESNFTMTAKGASGKIATISGYAFMNARILPNNTDFSGKKNAGANDIYYRDEIDAIVSSSVPYNASVDETNTVNTPLPEQFKIVGAVVDKDPNADNPMISLRRYKYYNQLLAHTRISAGVTADDTSVFMSRAEFIEHLSDQSDTRCKTIPADAIAPELAPGFKVEDPKLWVNTLLIEAAV